MKDKMIFKFVMEAFLDETYDEYKWTLYEKLQDCIDKAVKLYNDKEISKDRFNMLIMFARLWFDLLVTDE